MFTDVDPSKVDQSVLSSLPIDIRREVEREMRLATSIRKQDDNKLKKKKAMKNDNTKMRNKRQRSSYRQATETSEGKVEILCFACRRDPQEKRQQTLQQYFLVSSTDKTKKAKKDDETTSAGYFCERCRVPLRQQEPTTTTPLNSSSAAPNKKHRVVTILPQATRLKGYKRLAKETGVPFALTDSEVMKIMRQTCFGCGKAGGQDGNGISRLRNWEGFSIQTKAKAIKPYMGPFSLQNCIAACSVCNLMKGHRTIPSFVEACRTIATHNFGGRGCNNGSTGGENHRHDDDSTTATATTATITTTTTNFGRYPNRFRNNISKRSRSCYITKSSTHTKTHSLTNEQFNSIVAQPCAYCGKAPQAGVHYNGLDRLDSNNRVYSLENVVSCCGDCNIMKYKHSVDFFLKHCRSVAVYHQGTVFEEDDKEKDGEDGGAKEEEEEEEKVDGSFKDEKG